MSYQIFNEASLGKFIELIQNKVRSIVDNATVASARSATNATNDADGNVINTTYRKVADSYSKTEVDNKVSNSPKSITITTDDLIKNYNCSKLLDLLENGNTIYLQLTHSDPVYYNDDKTLSIYEYGKSYGQYRIVWGSLLCFDGTLVSFTVTASEPDIVGTISLSYMIKEINTLTTVSTISIAASAWNSTSKTATVSVSDVEKDNAVDVAPAESSYDDYVNAGIRATAQSDGKLTFTCKTVPTKAISVNIKAISTGPLRNENRTKK